MIGSPRLVLATLRLKMRGRKAPREVALQRFSARARRSATRGAALGLTAGLIGLAGGLAAAAHCLPDRIASPASPGPWICSDPAFAALGLLAFPVNLLTNDLGQAVVLAPLALVSYGILGALIGLGLDRPRPSPPGG